MKQKRTRIILFFFIVCALFVAILQPARVNDPTYKGKLLSVWFKEYAYSSNAPPPGLYSFPYSANARVVRWMGGVSNIASGALPLGSLRGPTPPWPGDPALDALRALGSNAVPYLVRQLRYDRADRAYIIAFTNFPTFVQRKLPSPGEKQWYRIRAIDALAELRESAKGAAPVLLELLHENDPGLRSRVIKALRSIGADRDQISALMAQLNSEGRDDEVLEIAGHLGWKNRETARLLGKILSGPDSSGTLHRKAISLLEDGGVRAAPAAEQIIAALKHSDSEVRYLAARSLEQIAKDIPPDERPELELRLRAGLSDKSVIVRNVSRRVLLKLGATNVPPPIED